MNPWHFTDLKSDIDEKNIITASYPFDFNNDFKVLKIRFDV